MTATDKYWLCVNKKNIIWDIVAVIFFIVIFNSIPSITICYFLVRIGRYSMYFLSMNWFASNKQDGLNQILIMPFSRDQIYKTYIKMMLIQSFIYTVAVAAAQIVSKLTNETNNMAIDNKPIIITPIVQIGFYLNNVFIMLLIFNFLVKLINNYSIKSKFGLVFFIIYSVMINALASVLINENTLKFINQYIYISIASILIILITCIFVRNIKKSYDQFVIKHRRGTCVN